VLFKSRIFGQEKLDLLAGNEVQILCSLLWFSVEDTIKNAVRAPFDFEKLKRSVEAQYEGKFPNVIYTITLNPKFYQHMPVKSRILGIQNFPGGILSPSLLPDHLGSRPQVI
jgi:hypothetical protein